MDIAEAVTPREIISTSGKVRNLNMENSSDSSSLISDDIGSSAKLIADNKY